MLTDGEGNTDRGAIASHGPGPTESKTPRMRGHSMHENREIPRVPAHEGWAGRPEKVKTRTTGMNACGKSDKPIVPVKPPNKTRRQMGLRRRWREGA